MTRHEKRLLAIQDQTDPKRIALIRAYYPALILARIIGCLDRQQDGDFLRCCTDPWCPACSPRESHKRALSQLKAFQALTPPGKRTRLAHEVFTLPPLLRPLVATCDGMGRWRKAVISTIRELHGAQVAGIMNLHPMGDKDIRKHHPHWDVVLNGWIIQNGKARAVHSPIFDFEHGRDIYRHHVSHAFEIEGSAVPEKIDAWWDRKTKNGATTIWHTSSAKHWHMLRYSARNVYQPDKAWMPPEHQVREGRDWAYKPKTNEPAVYYEGQEVLSNLLAQRAWLDDKMEHVWFGYMHGPRRADALHAMGKQDSEPDA